MARARSAQRPQLTGFGPREERASKRIRRWAEVRCSAELDDRFSPIASFSDRVRWSFPKLLLGDVNDINHASRLPAGGKKDGQIRWIIEIQKKNVRRAVSFPRTA